MLRRSLVLYTLVGFRGVVNTVQKLCNRESHQVTHAERSSQPDRASSVLKGDYT